MISLTLICHASTASTRTRAFPADEPVDPRGLRRLARVPPVRATATGRSWTSPASRAVQTAAALRLEAALDPSLRECDYGRWTGLTLDDVAARDPEGIGDWLRDPASAPHGGESILDLMDRVASWIDRTAGAPGRTVAVTHASVIRAAVVRAMGAPPSTFWRLDVAPLSTTVLTGGAGRWTLRAMTPLGPPGRRDRPAPA